MAEKITIDVLTLDSVQCAACTYMMESIAALPDDIQEMITFREWSIKSKEGIGKFTELKARVLPTICMNGDLVFQSMIPQYEELIDALVARAPSDAFRSRLLALRAGGFDFDKIRQNLAGAGAGRNTRNSSWCMMGSVKLLIEVMYKRKTCLSSIYMEETVQQLVPEYAGKIIYSRVDLSSPQGAKRFLELSCSLFGEEGVYQFHHLAPVPSLFINAELVFDVIPSRDELEKTIAAYTLNKGSLSGIAGGWHE